MLGFAAGERRIEASIMDFALIVSVNGPAHFVAECGQQLAWLGASLQPSQQGHFSCTTPGLVSISPQPLTCIANSMTKQFHTSPEDARRLETAHNNHNGEYPNHNWAITFESDQREALIPNRFFQNLMPCFTTRGYPTLRRPSSCAGLEVSEDLISTLLESESVHIDRVQGYLSISTFSHEFQLARTEDSIIVWHPTRSPDHVCTCGFHQTPWKDSQPFIDINEANLLRYRHVFEYCPRSRTLSESEDFVRGVSCPDTPEGARIELTEDAELSSSTHTSSRYTSIDSDMLSISDMSDELSSKPRDPGDPLTQLLETAAHRLLAEFRNEEGSGPNPFASPSSAWADCFAAATDEDESGNSEGQSGTQPGRPLKSRRAGSTSRGTIQPSRKRGRPDDEEEENNNGQPPRKKSPNKKGLQYGEKLLACPFWKLDPVKHRKCFTRAQVDTSYIKQHLRAHHYIEFYCQRCFCTFESQKMRESHSMNVQCIPKDPKYLEGVRLSHEQSHKLRQKLKGKLPEEKWFALWVVLFPSHRRPPSPFVANGLSEDLCDFLGFGTSHGTKILNETLQSSGYLQPRLNESLLLELLRGVQNRLYDEWLASRISSAQVDGGVSDEVSTSSFADSGLPTQIHPTPFGALPPAISLSPFTDSTRSYPMPSNATAPPISTSAFEGSGLPPSDTILPPQHLGAVSAPGTFQPDESSHWQGFNCDYTTEDFTYHAAFNDISDNPLNLDDFDEWLSKTQEGHSNVHTQV